MVAEHTIDIIESAHSAWIRQHYQANGFQNPFGHQLEEAGDLSSMIARGHKVLEQCDSRFREASVIPQIATALLDGIATNTETHSRNDASEALSGTNNTGTPPK